MANDLIMYVLYLVVLLLLALPLGKYMAKVFTQQSTIFDFAFKPIEKIIYRITGVKETEEMNWKQYVSTLVIFNFFGMIMVYLIQVWQDVLPFNPEKLAGVDPWHLALNTAVSFMTNTNWQSYTPETTMSYFTQMTVLTVQNFLSAATGLTVAIAFIRGLTRTNYQTIGNFWVDMVRSVVWVLLPLSIILSIVLVQQGVLQNLSPYATVQSLDGGGEQKLPMGPVASQEAIKTLGTNGGGFFNANSAHPFENPTPLSNFLEMLSMFLIPAGIVFTFGHMAKDKRQSYAIVGAMTILFVIMLGTMYMSESYGNPILNSLGVSSPTSMEGKEVRFGIAGSALFSTITTATSTGAVNAMHDSYTPLGGLVAMLQIKLGEIIFGGVGSGFYSMMMFVIITVFIVGLMVGRTPEYLGKKIEARETKMATIAILIPSVIILIGSGIASIIDQGTATLNNSGPHGLSEILYAFASAAGNNGSAFAGLSANNPFYNLMLAFNMVVGRFSVIIPALAIAGSMAGKKISPPGPGTFATNGWLFVVLLVGVVLIVGALTFLPVLSLGPIVEQLLMLQGTTF